MIPLAWRSHTRAALTLNSAASRWPIALKAATTMLVVLGVPTLLGHPGIGMLGSLGTFTVLYGAAAPARFRIRLLSLVALGFVVSAIVGALTHPWPWLELASLTSTVFVMVVICAALRVGPPGAYFFALVQGVAGLAAGHGNSPVLIVACAAGGALVALAFGMSDLLFDPTRPERRAVEAAEEAMDRFEREIDGDAMAGERLAVSRALHAAWTSVTDAGSAERFTDRLWAVQARYVAAVASRAGGELGVDPTPWGSAEGGEGLAEDLDLAGDLDADGQVRAGGEAEPRRLGRARRLEAEQIRDTSLGRPSGLALLHRALDWPSEALLTAARAGLATFVAGGIAVAIGNEHLYWAASFGALVLHQGGTRDAQTVRGIQRFLGTSVGLIIFAGIQGLGLPGWAIVLVIAVMQGIVELLVAVNYGLAVMWITPMALTLGLGASGGAGALAMLRDRAVDTVIGIVVALLVLQLVGRRMPVPMLRGYARTVAHRIDAVLTDLAIGRVEHAQARENRRRLYHALLESEEVARRALANDPVRVPPYRAMEQALSDLGYLVLGMAWHPDVREARSLAEQARTPLALIFAHSVRGDRSAEDIHRDVAAVGEVVHAWEPPS